MSYSYNRSKNFSYNTQNQIDDIREFESAEKNNDSDNDVKDNNEGTFKIETDNIMMQEIISILSYRPKGIIEVICIIIAIIVLIYNVVMGIW